MNPEEKRVRGEGAAGLKRQGEKTGPAQTQGGYMKNIDLCGKWTCMIPGWQQEVLLPGTLDEWGIGEPDDPERQWKAEEVKRIGFWKKGDPIVTRLTRKHTFEGAARISRSLEWDKKEGKRYFVDAERARMLKLEVNGREAAPCRPGCLSAPWCFEVTGLVTGRDEFTFLSDNSYPGWPREAIVYSSAASDETQTNWNGILGSIRIREEGSTFLSDVRVYACGGDEDAAVIEIDSADGWEGEIRISSEALEEDAVIRTALGAGRHEIRCGLKIRKDAARWDIGEGRMQEMTVSAPGLETRSARFGIRSFRAEKGRLTISGRRIFLRGEANCAVFPETGYCPMEKDEWKEILRKYREYGVNCMRFHSHCPPEAAFAAADEVGMLMQPELSHWDPEHAFESEASRQYYRHEMIRILQTLACHPSFVMLSLGNELHAGAEGHAWIGEMLKTARAADPTRLYTGGSNLHYGQLGTESAGDFYTAMGYMGMEMRATCDGMTGWLNHEYPGTCHDYSSTMNAIRRNSGLPVFSFEVGQYEVLPETEEVSRYRGVTRADNLTHIREKAREKGLEKDWKRMREASGESSLLCYRAEVEAAMRTEEYSGISLLGLQDFPGQGTALVGMMNAHLEPKSGSFARPERFAVFFRDVLPLALMDRYTWTEGETLTVRVRLANYGKHSLSGKTEWTLEGEGGRRRCGGMLEDRTAPAGGLTDLGEIRIGLADFPRPEKLTLILRFCGARNEYPVWVYPPVQPECPPNVYECRSLDGKARDILRAGGTVYLAPDSTEEALPNSIQAQFSPDFWSVCTFPHQAGGMGQLIDESHPLFRDFPTESFSNWQWWPMAGQRAMILPEKIDAIIAEMDSYAYLRPMAKLFECRCGGGKLMVSSLGLHSLQQYPEARALQAAIYAYLASDRFAPAQELTEEWIQRIFRSRKTDYGLLLRQAEEIIRTDPGYVPALSNLSALLMDMIPQLNWAGFYLLRGDRLVVGPFQGKPACIHIPVGKGVCGTSIAKDEALNVPDVHAFPGHIACDSASRSEMVIPLHRQGKPAAVLDMDSPVPNRFSTQDAEELKKLAGLAERLLCWEDA